MTDIFDPNTTQSEPVHGRILIVDDDPVAVGMLAVSLGAAGHDVVEANSGEEALGWIAECVERHEALPDVVFLDIEMGMGIDGYEACRRLLDMEAARDLPVIFLSGHDELDDRLRAYDAGGSDFVAKPFVPDEVLRKAASSIRYRRRQQAAVADHKTSFDTAMTAIATLGESGVTLKFSRGALGCRTQQALARLMIESLASFGLDCHVQIRVPAETLTFTASGTASPLEESVFEKMRSMGRIFSFRNRMIVNYDTVSMLVTNMPADDDLCGRIRDHAAMIVEAAELAVDNIDLRTETARRADELRRLAEASRQAIEDLRVGYRELQVATRHELETMATTIEGMYLHLGLTNEQEFTISDTVRSAVDHVVALIEHGHELDESFVGIVESLDKASEFGADQENEPPEMAELW